MRHNSQGRSRLAILLLCAIFVIAFTLILVAFIKPAFSDFDDDDDQVTVDGDHLDGTWEPDAALDYYLQAGRQKHESTSSSSPPPSLYHRPEQLSVQSSHSVRVGLIFFTVDEVSRLLNGEHHRLHRVATLPQLPSTVVHFQTVLHSRSSGSQDHSFDALILNAAHSSWQSSSSSSHEQREKPSEDDIQTVIDELKAKYPSALLLLYSDLPPPIAPVFRVICKSLRLARHFDSSLLYHPRSFWAFQQPIPAPSDIENPSKITRDRSRLAIVNLGRDTDHATEWLARLDAALRQAGVVPDRIDHASLDTALTYPAVVVVDRVFCEGYADPWVYRALADEQRIVAYLGAPQAHFVLHNRKQLIDIRNFPNPDTLSLYLSQLLLTSPSSSSSSSSSSSPSASYSSPFQEPLDPYGYKPSGLALEPQVYSVVDVLDDLAAVLAWKKLLDPLPALSPLPVRLTNTCTNPEKFFGSFASKHFDFFGGRENGGLDLLLYHAGDPFYNREDRYERSSSACLHAGVRSCTITHDQSALEVADAILLHERKTPVAAELKKHPWQPVLGYSMESALNDLHPLSGGARKKAFSLLAGLHPGDNDAVLSYIWEFGRLGKGLAKSYEEKTEFSKLQASVYWAASHCISWRDRLVQDLMSFVPIDSYGACVTTMDRDDPASKVHSSYKFYLSVENSVCLDYHTEKLWVPLFWGNIPLYFGAPNALEVVPTTHSVIPLDRFHDHQHLTDCIRWLAHPDQRPAYEFFVEQHLAQGKVRPGFAYHLFNTLPPCDREVLLCNTIANKFAQISAARDAQSHFPSRHVSGDRSCSQLQEPVIFPSLRSR